MTGPVIPTAVGMLAGGGAGVLIRILLGRLERGAQVGPGPIEVGSAIVTAAGVWLAWGTPQIGLVLFAGWLLVALSAVDVAHHRLPDALTLSAFPVAGAVAMATWLVAPESGSPVRGLLVAGAFLAVFAGLASMSPRSMGRGDAKLVPTLGLLTGYVSVPSAVLGIALAFVLGAMFSLLGLLAGRLKMKSVVPFGPFLLIGAWVMLAMPAIPALVRA